MSSTPDYEVIIIGGGLAGLSLAIQLADARRKVLLVEKNSYPFHRVCGEYISMESWDFLERIGLPLSSMQLPRIKRLKISSLKGLVLEHALNPGGFGISRFTLDHLLAQLALKEGAEVRESCRVDVIEKVKEGDRFRVITPAGIFETEVVVGAFGKRSNLDKKLGRSFEQRPSPSSKNWTAVKYHLAASSSTNDFPDDDTVELHNFKDGYCGISKVDGDKYCLCYLTKAENLRKFKGDISAMEEKLLSKNPFLEKYFSRRENFLFAEPVTISQITFQKKLPVEKEILMLGDASGMIAPLCGNGMSMAMHASVILFPILLRFLNHEISREKMQRLYSEEWNGLFAARLAVGRLLQPFMLNPALTNLSISILRRSPFLMNRAVLATHGEAF